MKMTGTGIALLALGLLTTGVSSAQAQGLKRGAIRPARMAQAGKKNAFAEMLLQLDLTPAQKQQIGGIARAEQTQVKSIKTNATLAPADKTAQEKAARKASRTQILAVLTPAQKAQLKQLVAQRRLQKAQTAAAAAGAATPGTPTGTVPKPPVGTAPAPAAPVPPAGAKSGASAPASTTGKGTAAKDDDLDDLDDLA